MELKEGHFKVSIIPGLVVTNYLPVEARVASIGLNFSHEKLINPKSLPSKSAPAA